jgi:large subunit ribosomal protein L18
MKNLQSKLKRQKRVRGKIRGTQIMPRLSVHRSNKSIYAQIIDDTKGKTLIYVSGKELPVTKADKDSKDQADKNTSSGENTAKKDKAYQLGELLAQKALKSKIKKVKFDRGSYRYHGRVKALADGARKGGLEF